VLGRYGFTPRPPRCRPLADGELLVKVFGCDREYYKRVRFDQSIGAYHSADEPDSLTISQIDPPPDLHVSGTERPRRRALDL
jgi:hypothetical protein